MKRKLCAILVQQLTGKRERGETAMVAKPNLLPDMQALKKDNI